MSATWQNERVCVPSPWTSSGSPASALPTKRGIDHPVLAALTRADGVEEPGDDAVEAALLVEGEREELVHRLRVGVEPAALASSGRRRAGRPPTAAAPRGGRRRPPSVDAISTRLPNFVQYSSTVSVPWTFVTIVCTGCSTIRRTPTAAARW